MPLPPNDSAASRRSRRTACTVGLMASALVSLLGCADTHWERAFYQGATYSNEQCQLKRKPTDAPCAELLDYARYERERARAKNAPPPSSRVDPIQEQPQ